MVALRDILGRPPRILFACAAGMSSSILARQLRREVKGRGLDWRVRCMEVEAVLDETEPFELLLLGPQVDYKVERLQRHFGAQTVVASINQRTYAFCDGAALVDQVQQLLDEYLRCRFLLASDYPAPAGDEDAR